MDATHFGHPEEPVLLVRELVREVVAREAPEETALMDRLYELDDADVGRLLGRRRRGDLLGYGIGETVVMATPVLWVVVNEAAKRFTNSTITGGGKAAKAGLRKLFGRSKSTAVMPTLTPEQIQHVWTRTVESALRQGMSEKRAQNLADCLAGRLTLAAQQAPDHPSGDQGRPSKELPRGNAAEPS